MKRHPAFELALNAALALGAAALVLATVELALRLTVYRFEPYPKSPGPNSVYRIETPEFRTTGRTNSLNMRDREIGPKRPGERRVLCLGDSFTFGLGVNMDDAYPQVLERLLRGRGEDARVINGGTGGAASEALEFLELHGFGFGPDTVVVQVFVGNDFYDGQRRLAASPQAAAAPAAAPSFAARLKEALKLRSVTADFLWNRLIQVPALDRFFYRMNLRYSNRGIYLKEHPELERRLVDFELDALSRMHRACRDRGIEMVVLVVPEKQQLFMRGELDPAVYDLRRPNRILAAFCAREGLALVDMADVYDAIPEKRVRTFYYVQDMHWTAAGNLHAAETLAAVLTKPAAGGTIKT